MVRGKLGIDAERVPVVWILQNVVVVKALDQASFLGPGVRDLYTVHHRHEFVSRVAAAPSEEGANTNTN